MRYNSVKWFFVVCEKRGGGYEKSIVPEDYLKNLINEVFSVELESLSVAAYAKAEALANEKLGDALKEKIAEKSFFEECLLAVATFLFMAANKNFKKRKAS